MFLLWTKSLIYSIYTLFSLSAHPIYLTSTEVDYNTKSKTLEISVKIFADDLEQVLSQSKKRKIELGTDREDPNTKELLIEYFNKHLLFYTDNKLRNYKYIGHEPGDKSDMFAMYVYLEIDKVEPFKILKIKNSILTDNLSNQLNFTTCHTSTGLKKVISRKGDLIQEVYW